MAKTPRMSDTAALQSMPTSTPQNHMSEHTSIRKIDNGFIVSQSSCKDGQYSSKEYHTAELPNLNTDEAATDNPMKRAIEYMSRNNS